MVLRPVTDECVLRLWTCYTDLKKSLKTYGEYFVILRIGRGSPFAHQASLEVWKRLHKSF